MSSATFVSPNAVTSPSARDTVTSNFAPARLPTVNPIPIDPVKPGIGNAGVNSLLLKIPISVPLTKSFVITFNRLFTSMMLSTIKPEVFCCAEYAGPANNKSTPS